MQAGGLRVTPVEELEPTRGADPDAVLEEVLQEHPQAADEEEQGAPVEHPVVLVERGCPGQERVTRRVYWLVRLQLARLLLCRHDVLRSAAGQGPTSHLDF